MRKLCVVTIASILLFPSFFQPPEIEKSIGRRTITFEYCNVIHSPDSIGGSNFCGVFGVQPAAAAADPQIEKLIADLGSKDVFVMALAIAKLRKAKAAAKPAVPKLIHLLGRLDQIAMTLSLAGRDGEFETLGVEYGSAPLSPAYEAMKTLDAIEPAWRDGAEADGALKEMISMMELRACADTVEVVNALGMLKSDQAFEVLLESLFDDSEEIRIAARSALYKVDACWHSNSLYSMRMGMVIMRIPREKLKLYPITADGAAFRSDAAAAATDGIELKKCIADLSDGSSEVRAYAAYRLGELGDAGALGPLYEAAPTMDFPVAKNAIDSIRQLDRNWRDDPRAAVMAKKLVAAVEGSDQQYYQAQLLSLLMSLGFRAGQAEVEAFYDRTKDDYLRSRINMDIAALGKKGAIDFISRKVRASNAMEISGMLSGLQALDWKWSEDESLARPVFEKLRDAYLKNTRENEIKKVCVTAFAGMRIPEAAAFIKRMSKSDLDSDRMAVLEAAGARGDSESVKILSSMIGDASDSIMLRAGNLLDYIDKSWRDDERGKKYAERAIAIFADRKGPTRDAIAASIAKFPGSAAVELLARTVDFSDVSRATASLRVMVTADRDATMDIIEAAFRGGLTDEAKAAIVRDALGASVDKSDRLARFVTRQIAEGGEEVASAAVYALDSKEAGDYPAGVRSGLLPLIEEGLKSRDTKVSARMLIPAWKFGVAGAFEAAMAKIVSNDAKIAALAVEALLRYPEEKTVPALVKFIGGSEKECSAAYGVLGTMLEARIIDTLADTLVKSPNSSVEFIKFLDGRHIAWRKLTKAREAMAAIVMSLGSPDAQTKLAACGKLEYLAYEEAFDSLAVILRTKEPRLRDAAAAAIARCGRARALVPLLDLLDDGAAFAPKDPAVLFGVADRDWRGNPATAAKLLSIAASVKAAKTPAEKKEYFERYMIVLEALGPYAWRDGLRGKLASASGYFVALAESADPVERSIGERYLACARKYDRESAAGSPAGLSGREASARKVLLKFFMAISPPAGLATKLNVPAKTIVSRLSATGLIKGSCPFIPPSGFVEAVTAKYFSGGLSPEYFALLIGPFEKVSFLDALSRRLDPASPDAALRAMDAIGRIGRLYNFRPLAAMMLSKDERLRFRAAGLLKDLGYSPFIAEERAAYATLRGRGGDLFGLFRERASRPWGPADIVRPLSTFVSKALSVVSGGAR